MPRPADDGNGRRRILVLGGGSGGLELAVRLAADRTLDVTLVDQVAAHIWKPRLHEFAAGTVSTSLSEISFYLLARSRGFHFEQGTVVGIDRASRRVRLAAVDGQDGGGTILPERALAYHVCVVALGGVTPDFGVPGVAEHAVRLDARVDADRFRDRFTDLMIAARNSGRPAEIVIVGSGATGTELAAHLRNAERAFFASDKVVKLLGLTILEAAPKVMPSANDDLRREVLARLKELDVTVVTGARIAAVEAEEVRSADGKSWPAAATVWAAGLVGNPVLARLADFALDEKGRIRADRFLRSTVDEAIYVMGDSSNVTGRDDATALPPTAQAASQEASYLAAAIPVRLRGGEPKPFSYHDKGQLVSLAGAGTVGLIGLPRKNDILVHGKFAIAAYRGLERQHQWRVLGPFRGSLAILADTLSPIKGPALKLHG